MIKLIFGACVVNIVFNFLTLFLVSKYVDVVRVDDRSVVAPLVGVIAVLSLIVDMIVLVFCSPSVQLVWK